MSKIDQSFEEKKQRVLQFLECNGMMPKEHQIHRLSESEKRRNFGVRIPLGNLYAESEFNFYPFVSTCSLFVTEPK